MTVEPCYAAANDTEDDLMCHELVHFIPVEAVMGCCPETWPYILELGRKGILLSVHYSCKKYCKDCHCKRCGGNGCLDMDIIGLAVECNEMSERNETCHARHGCKENERKRHLPGSVVRSVMAGLFVFGVLLPPENEIVQTEHVECRKGCHHGHPCTPEPVAVEHRCDHLVLREEAREREDTGDCETADEECPVGNRHILAETTHFCIVV